MSVGGLIVIPRNLSSQTIIKHDMKTQELMPNLLLYCYIDVTLQIIVGYKVFAGPGM